MKKRWPYTYVLLRYRHDPLAGEFVNVGVVLHSPQSKYLGAKLRKTLGRLGKMFPGIEKRDVSASLAAVERALNNLKPTDQGELLDSELFDAAAFARKALPSDDSSYVWGPLCTGLTENPVQTLDTLYHRFVSRFDEDMFVRRDDASIWKPVRDKLSAEKLSDRLQPKTVVSPLDTVHFGSAWKNGAWHCYQALSFDLASADGIRDKAARWSGHMLGASRSDEEIKPYFLVGAPSEASLAEVFDRAIELLRASELRPTVYREEQVDELVETIISQIDHHETRQ